MQTIINPYYKFKPYQAFQNKHGVENKKNTLNIRPLIGAAAGVAAATLITSKMFHKPLFKKPENLKTTTFQDVTEMLTMAGLANIGGVIGGSIGKNKNSIKKKIHEAGFQIMNTSIPMLMVTAVIKTCESVKKLNKAPIKIIGSFAAMTSGAVIATLITNKGKPKQEKRRYTIKDSLANFDDIIATIKIGFKRITDIVPVDKILPFIYIYNGFRAGNKE